MLLSLPNLTTPWLSVFLAAFTVFFVGLCISVSSQWHFQSIALQCWFPIVHSTGGTGLAADNHAGSLLTWRCSVLTFQHNFRQFYADYGTITVDLHASTPKLELHRLSTDCTVRRCLYYRALDLLKVPQESTSQSLQSRVPMVPSQLASNRCWHQSCIVIAEEGKLLEPVTWQTAHTELLLMMMVVIWFFWKGLLTVEAHGSNRKARYVEISRVQDPRCQHTA